MSISSRQQRGRLRAGGARRARRSFTLIETIALIVVLSVALPPSLFALREAALDRVGPVQASRARWLATAQLEDVIADRHSDTRGYDFLNSSNYPAESSVIGYPGFSRVVAFTETKADLVTPGQGCMIVTVTVSWPDPKRGMRSLAVSTVLTDYDQ